MLLKSHVEELLTMTADKLTRIARQTGYTDAEFKTCEFVGITNSGDFAYKTTYFDFDANAVRLAKLYVWRDESGNYIAEY